MRDDEVQVGMEVVLGRHRASDSSEGIVNWVGEMERYVGTAAKITSLRKDPTDNLLYGRVDSNYFHWRIINMRRKIINMQPVGYKSVSSPDSIPVCIECGLPNPYAEPTSTYICGTCRGWKEALK